MKINQDFIQECYYSSNLRQTGKSKILEIGIHNYDSPFHLVCLKVSEGERLSKKNPNAKYVTPDNFLGLRGSSLPIIFDQEVVALLLSDLWDKNIQIEVLKEQINKNNNSSNRNF